MGAVVCSARSDRAARAAGADAGAGVGADPLRADARVAVHVLPRCGADHGVRSRRDAARRRDRAALRRCPSLELRDLRDARAEHDVRRQRLRRDPSRSVGVGRQAPRRQPRGRRPRPRLLGQAARRGRPGRRRGVPDGDARIRRQDEPRGLVRAPRCREDGCAVRARVQCRAGREDRRRHREGAYEGQPAGLRQADPPRRRRAADHQRPAADRAGRRTVRGRELAGPRAGAEGPVPRLPPYAHDRPSPAARAVRPRPHRAQGRRCRQRRYPRLDRALPRPRR